MRRYEGGRPRVVTANCFDDVASIAAGLPREMQCRTALACHTTLQMIAIARLPERGLSLSDLLRTFGTRQALILCANLASTQSFTEAECRILFDRGWSSADRSYRSQSKLLRSFRSGRP